MVPTTGIPNRKPAWTLLVRSNPGRQSPKKNDLAIRPEVKRVTFWTERTTFTSDVRVSGGGESSVRALSPPEAHLQQHPLGSGCQAEPGGVTAHQTEETPDTLCVSEISHEPPDGFGRNFQSEHLNPIPVTTVIYNLPGLPLNQEFSNRYVSEIIRLISACCCNAGKSLRIVSGATVKLGELPV